MTHNEEHANNDAAEKDKFFKNLNSFLVNSGILAAGIKSFTNNIKTQVDTAKKDAENKIITNGLVFFGALFALYGTVQVLTNYFNVAMYTNLILGGSLLLCAFVFKVIRK